MYSILSYNIQTFDITQRACAKFVKLISRRNNFHIGESGCKCFAINQNYERIYCVKS